MKWIFRLIMLTFLITSIVIASNIELESVSEPNMPSELDWLKSSQYWIEYSFTVESDESTSFPPVRTKIYAYTVKEHTYGGFPYDSNELIEHGIDISSLPTHEVKVQNSVYQLPYIEVDSSPITYHWLYIPWMLMICIPTIYFGIRFFGFLISALATREPVKVVKAIPIIGWIIIED